MAIHISPYRTLLSPEHQVPLLLDSSRVLSCLVHVVTGLTRHRQYTSVTKSGSSKAPHQALSREYHDCDAGNQWCTVDEEAKWIESASASATSASATAHPSPAPLALGDDYGLSNFNGTSPPPDSDYGSETAHSATYTDSTSQAGVAIAATVGTLVFIGSIVVLIYLYRFLRRARDAKERERRIKKERRHMKVYIKPATTSPSRSGSSPPGGRTGRSRSRSRRRARSTAPSPGVRPARFGGGYDRLFRDEFEYCYAQTSVGVHYGSQLPSPPPPAQLPNQSPSTDQGPRTDPLQMAVCRPLIMIPPVSGPVVRTVPPGPSTERPSNDPIAPLGEMSSHHYRRHTADAISPSNSGTVPPEGYAVGTPTRFASEDKGYPGKHGDGMGNPMETMYSPVAYRGGPVTPVWDSDGALEEIYLEERTGMYK